MREPREALEAARRTVAGQGGEPEAPAHPGDPVLSDRRLVEWAIIEPEEAKVYSTRSYGRPITVFKRLLVRLLRQYLLEVSAQQSRFNTLVAARVLQLEERVEKLEAERWAAASLMRVSQVLCAAGPVDAVTNQALAWRDVFAGWGWTGGDYAAHVAPGLPAGRLGALRELRPERGELVVLHYSGYVRGLEELVDRSPRTLLISHNVTPARYFWAHEPVTAAHCALAQAQLAELARAAAGLVGVSEFNAQDLRRLSGREATVIPILFDVAGLPAPSREARGRGEPTILFVGRLAPHKRQDLVIRAFARYRRGAPAARLVLVGVPMNEEFELELRSLSDELAPGGVRFRSGISRAELADAYRGADVFLCLSEHEGFCIPLLEAFHYGLPVIARDSGAVGEVLDDAGVLVSDKDGTGVIAELVRLVLTDDELRTELRARGRRRLEAFDPRRTTALLHEALEDLANVKRDRSLTVRVLARLGHPRLRRMRARAAAAGGLPAAALSRLEARPLTVLTGRGQGLRFDLRRVRIDHAHFGAIAHGLLEISVQEALVRHLGEGGVLYDVGANVGFFSLLGARLAGCSGHVYAFEPAPESAAAIEAHAALNGARNVTVIRRAASSHFGRGRLQLVDDRSWSKLQEYGAHPSTERLIEVDLVAIDELVASGELPPPSVIKIDVEGAELEVLEGLRQTLHHHGPAVICELHGTHQGFLAAMSAAGYRVVNLEGSRRIDEDPGAAHALALPRLDSGD